MVYKHTILLSDGEQEMLQKLINQRGYRKQDVFRSRLRELYRREFPAYSVSKKKRLFEEFTNREYCERIKHGTVEGNVCVIPKSNGEVERIPLARVKILG